MPLKIWAVYEVYSYLRPRYIRIEAIYNKRNWYGFKQDYIVYLEWWQIHPITEPLSGLDFIRELTKNQIIEYQERWISIPISKA